MNCGPHNPVKVGTLSPSIRPYSYLLDRDTEGGKVKGSSDLDHAESSIGEVTGTLASL